MFLLPLAIGAFYTVITFTTAHCSDFQCEPMKEPVKFEAAAKAGKK